MSFAGQLTSPAGSGHAATFTGAEVKLDASASTDPEGDALTYVWTLTGKPAASAAAIKGSGALVTVVPDVSGAYTVSVRVTDSKGAYTDKQASLVVAANAAPVAVVDGSRLSAVAGTVANPNAGNSSDGDGDGDKLTYAWALDSRPAGSAATINGSAAQLAFTPDVAGAYSVSVTVSDGKVASVAHVTIAALTTSVATTRLPFKPLISRYSKGLDLFVTVSSGPDLLNIVDPFTSLLRQVSLPGAVKEMTLGPDGKLVVTLHEGVISVVDVENAVLLRSSPTGGAQTEAFITNVGMVYLMGQPDNSTNGQLVTVINGKTGVDMTSTLSASFGGTSTFTSSVGGVYSGLRHTAYVARL